eukprot:m.290969 g.290969  ORF g.290969 m.290969 type:complete len:156 (+) comp40721_c1_seq16:2526-2993(+)
MPLGFSTEKPPSQEVLCDNESCVESTTANATLLSCGHCFHASCLPGTLVCPICEPFLIEKVKTSSKAFNKSIKGEKELPTDENRDELEDDIDQDEFDEETNEYYSSREFQRHLIAQICQIPPSKTSPRFVSEGQRARNASNTPQQFRILTFTRLQ